MKREKKTKTPPNITVAQLSAAVRKYIEDTGGPDRRPLDWRALHRTINR